MSAYLRYGRDLIAKADTSESTTIDIDIDMDIEMESDWHNSLKVGFDVQSLTYPTWLDQLLQQVGLHRELVLPPKVAEPGSVVGTVSRDLVTRFSFHPDCKIVAGVIYNESKNRS